MNEIKDACEATVINHLMKNKLIFTIIYFD